MHSRGTSSAGSKLVYVAEGRRQVRSRFRKQSLSNGASNDSQARLL